MLSDSNDKRPRRLWHSAADQRRALAGSVVLELGSGSGLAAIVAARCGATTYATDYGSICRANELCFPAVCRCGVGD